MSEKQIVIQQIKNISKNFFNYDNLINHSNNINYKNSKIGNIIKFNVFNYVSTFLELLNNRGYHILLNDDSLICFFYQFDDNDNIIKHCLYYIPAPSENILLAFQSGVYDSISDLDSNIIFALTELLERYIRIDYDLEGKKEIIHTNVHLHYGLASNKMRIPIYSKFYPEEFLYFVLKYVYESDDIRLENLNLIENKNAELSEIELTRFYLNNKLNV